VKLTRLNADGEVVGYFSDHVAEIAARREWDLWQVAPPSDAVSARNGQQLNRRCRSVETPIANLALEDVEPGDGDRVDYLFNAFMLDNSLQIAPMSAKEACRRVGDRLSSWYLAGAASVEVSRHLINRWRRPGKSSRDTDLGGAAEAAGALYVLKIKAPR